MRTVKLLDVSTWSAFGELAESSNSYPSGCWCMGFHPEGDRIPEVVVRQVDPAS